MPDDEPTARITLTQVYKELQHIAPKVHDLNTPLPTHIDATEKKLAEPTPDAERPVIPAWAKLLTAGILALFGVIAAIFGLGG